MTRIITLALLCAAFLVSLLPAVPIQAQATPQLVPQELLRRAVNLVAEARGTDRAPGWEQAVVNPTAQPLYRPDLSTPAYYEFSVEIAAATGTMQPAGFIVLATGQHDFPVAHWSAEGEAPSRLLTALAMPPGAAAPQGLKFYKLDVLSYVAEDQGGTLVAELGEMPARVTGLTAELLASNATVESEASPSITGDDSRAAEATYTTVITGNVQSPLTLSAWTDWAEMKREYNATYGPWLAELVAKAKGDWEVADLLQRNGDLLSPGDSYPLALLAAGAEVQLDGPGAAHVAAAQEGQSGPSPTLRIDVRSAVDGEFLPLAVQLRYPDGTSEQVNFIIGDRTAAARTRVFLPLVLGSGTPPPNSATTGQPVPENTRSTVTLSKSYGPWSTWTTHWAGAMSDQRLYRQLSLGEAPNSSGCVSGCGATAWAMLLGWVDFRASHSGSSWAKHWGAYRVNGGKGLDAVAPLYVDNGVKNMIWEIRNHVDTFCLGKKNGATHPSTMLDITSYLSGRSTLKVYDTYNIFGARLDKYRDRARDTIINGTPAIIGTGWLSHYPLAFGYQRRERMVYRKVLSDYVQYQREFYVNQGWGGNQNGWIPAETWYAGSVKP